MSEVILEKRWANYFGIETIDKNGQKHANVWVIRGNGTLKLTREGLFFSQWITKKEFFIPLSKVEKVEIGKSHNRKMKWPAKVLKVYYKEKGGEETKVFGVAPGGKLSLTKGWKDDVYQWKEEIDKLLIR